MYVMRRFLSGSDEEAAARLAQWRRSGSFGSVEDRAPQRHSLQRDDAERSSTSSQDSNPTENMAHARLAAAIAEVQQSGKMHEDLSVRAKVRSTSSADDVKDWYGTVIQL
ncbi:hypothetical protein LTR17_023815 [Elasticomyces elasticus]|nr:hypothetical protein LTR17_023815 [Elasticomyces elasticus]